MNSLIIAASKSVAVVQLQSALDTFEQHCRSSTPGSADSHCQTAQEQKYYQIIAALLMSLVLDSEANLQFYLQLCDNM